MRIRVCIALVTGSLIAASSAFGSTSGGRDVTSEYLIADGVYAANIESYVHRSDAHIFAALRGEKSVSVSIADQTGEAVRGHIYIDGGRDGDFEPAGEFCSGTPTEIRIPPRAKVMVRVLAGTCSDHTNAVATRGTIFVRFTR